MGFRVWGSPIRNGEFVHSSQPLSPKGIRPDMSFRVSGRRLKVPLPTPILSTGRSSPSGQHKLRLKGEGFIQLSEHRAGLRSA